MNPTRSLFSRPSNTIRGQSFSQLFKNLCFAFFVFSILAFSLFAFFHPPSRITSSNTQITSDQSQPFQSQPLDQSNRFDQSNDQQSTDQFEPLDQSADQSHPSNCDSKSPINCADPEVYHIMMRATIEAFPDVHFHRFGKPVSVDDTGTRCDMAWRYRPKFAKRPGTFKDYRRFDLLRLENCAYKVDKIGDYHTGFNARKKKANKKDGKDKLGSFNDVFDDESVFKSGKYLVYIGGGDRCKKMNHYLWSLFCSLGEAQFLNRTLVMDLNVCLSSLYSSWRSNEEGKDFRFYFDFESLRDSVIDQRQFWVNWELWRDKDKLGVHVIDDSYFAPMKLRNLKETLVIRKFGIVEPESYWYQVCEGDAKSHIQRPWNLLKKSPRLMDIVSNIASKLNHDFDSVKILSGQNANSTNLLADFVNVDALVKTLGEKIEHGRDLFIVTDLNQDFSGFELLRKKFKIHFLDDFRDFWGEKTEWFIETKNLNNGLSVEFDGYMRKEVNSEVFFLGKNPIQWDQDAKSFI